MVRPRRYPFRVTQLSEDGGVSPGDHACWSFGSQDEFRASVVAYLAEGVARNERVLFVGDRPDEGALLDDLAGLDGAADLVARKQLLLKPAHELYATSSAFDIHRQVDVCREMTETALGEGFSGFRCVADVTTMVLDPRRREEFLAYELAVDRFIAGAPMTAVCAVDERAAGLAASEVVCVHRSHQLASSSLEPGFRLVPDGDRFVLEGEIDISNHARFRRALSAAAAIAGDEVVLDLHGLRFIDISGADELAGMAEVLRPRRLQLVAPPFHLRTVASVLRWEARLGLAVSGRQP